MSELDAVVIRSAELADLEVITEIYKDAILTATATFDTEPKTEEKRRVGSSRTASGVRLLSRSWRAELSVGGVTKGSDRRAYDETAIDPATDLDDPSHAEANRLTRKLTSKTRAEDQVNRHGPRGDLIYHARTAAHIGLSRL